MEMGIGKGMDREDARGGTIWGSRWTTEVGGKNFPALVWYSSTDGKEGR